MKSYIIILLLLFLTSCNKSAASKTTDKYTDEEKHHQETSIGIKEKPKPINDVKHNLKETVDISSIFSKNKYIKNTRDKHSDWMTNKARTLRYSFDVGKEQYIVKTTSYEYKKDLFFFVHTLKSAVDSIPIKTMIERAQGKETHGYTTERILYFGMKNENEGSLIDIPPNWNHINLKSELQMFLQDQLNNDIIFCDRSKKCKYRDLRKINK